jgi:pantetheine-phosphate adenylyltransferase
MKVIYPGSFDPFHKGHASIVERAAKIFDFIYVVVAINTDKKSSALTSRFEKTKEAVTKMNLSNVSVIEYDGILVDLMKQLDVKVIVRGIRDEKDANYEIDLASNHYQLSNKEVYTVLLPTIDELKSVNSSYYRDELNRINNKIK